MFPRPTKVGWRRQCERKGKSRNVSARALNHTGVLRVPDSLAIKLPSNNLRVVLVCTVSLTRLSQVRLSTGLPEGGGEMKFYRCD